MCLCDNRYKRWRRRGPNRQTKKNCWFLSLVLLGLLVLLNLPLGARADHVTPLVEHDAQVVVDALRRLAGHNDTLHRRPARLSTQVDRKCAPLRGL